MLQKPAKISLWDQHLQKHKGISACVQCEATGVANIQENLCSFIKNFKCTPKNNNLQKKPSNI